MSTIVIRMNQGQASELASCIEQSLRHMGRAMSIFEDMKRGEASERRYGAECRTYPRMRDEWDYPEDYRRY